MDKLKEEVLCHEMRRARGIRFERRASHAVEKSIALGNRVQNSAIPHALKFAQPLYCQQLLYDMPLVQRLAGK
jgi:hypothetical protein